MKQNVSLIQYAALFRTDKMIQDLGLVLLTIMLVLFS
jgi:hypothetical protein